MTTATGTGMSMGSSSTIVRYCFMRLVVLVVAVLVATLAMLATLPGAHAQATFTPNLTFNLSTSSMSGMFNWSVPERAWPQRDLATGYVPWDVEWVAGDGNRTTINATNPGGYIGEGYPTHRVSSQYYSPNSLPRTTFGFPGTSYWMTGIWDPWNYTQSLHDIQINIDSSLYYVDASVRGQFGEIDQLSWAWHSVSYYVRDDYVGGGNLSIGTVWMTTGMLTDAPTLEEVNQTTLNFVDNSGKFNPDPVFLWSGGGGWTPQTSLSGPDNQGVSNYTHAVGNCNSSSTRYATVTLVIPANTSFIILNGTMGPEWSTWRLDWSPIPPFAFSPMKLESYSRWTVPGAMMMYMPLHPQWMYSLSISAEVGQNISVSSVTFFSGLYHGAGKGKDGPFGLSEGAGAGIIVVIVVVCLCIAGYVGYQVWRRLQRKRKPNTKTASGRSRSRSATEDDSKHDTELSDQIPHLSDYTGYTQDQLEASSGMASTSSTGIANSSTSTTTGTPSTTLAPRDRATLSHLAPLAITGRLREGSTDSQEIIYYDADGNPKRVTITPIAGPSVLEKSPHGSSAALAPRTSRNGGVLGEEHEVGPPLIDEMKLGLLRRDSPHTYGDDLRYGTESPSHGARAGASGSGATGHPLAILTGNSSPAGSGVALVPEPPRGMYMEQEIDAGAVPMYRTVPPVYDPAWALGHGQEADGAGGPAHGTMEQLHHPPSVSMSVTEVRGSRGTGSLPRSGSGNILGNTPLNAAPSEIHGLPTIPTAVLPVPPPHARPTPSPSLPDAHVYDADADVDVDHDLDREHNDRADHADFTGYAYSHDYYPGGFGYNRPGGVPHPAPSASPALSGRRSGATSSVGGVPSPSVEVGDWGGAARGSPAGGSSANLRGDTENGNWGGVQRDGDEEGDDGYFWHAL